jgi:hypothetical protein
VLQHLQPGAKSEEIRHRLLQIGNPKEIAQPRSLTMIMAEENIYLGQRNVDELLHVMIGDLKDKGHLQTRNSQVVTHTQRKDRLLLQKKCSL